MIFSRDRLVKFVIFSRDQLEEFMIFHPHPLSTDEFRNFFSPETDYFRNVFEIFLATDRIEFCDPPPQSTDFAIFSATN